MDRVHEVNGPANILASPSSRRSVFDSVFDDEAKGLDRYALVVLVGVTIGAMVLAMAFLKLVSLCIPKRVKKLEVAIQERLTRIYFRKRFVINGYRAPPFGLFHVRYNTLSLFSGAKKHVGLMFYLSGGGDHHH